MLKRISCFFVVVVVVVNGLFAQVSNDETESKTKIEQFSARTGVVIISGFEKIGTAQGLYSTSVSIECREILNASDGTKAYGIAIGCFKEDGKYDKEHISYIDYDEIDSLIQGIEYITKLNNEVTELESFQADYSTKGDLEISTFKSGDRVMASVKSGKIGGVTTFFNLSDLNRIKTLVVQAKAKIDSIKSGKV